MNIDEFINILREILQKGKEEDLLGLIYSGGLEIDDFMKEMVLLPFISLFKKDISITYKSFAEIPAYRQEKYTNSEKIEYIVYFHYASAEQETDNSAPVGKIENTYKIIL